MTATRLGLDQALPAVRADDTLVTPKLDRLARSIPAFSLSCPRVVATHQCCLCHRLAFPVFWPTIVLTHRL
jgi:hypothetical protein